MKKIIIINKLLLMLFSFFLALSPTVQSQELNSQQLKAAYLFNFVKHTSWPEEQNKTQFIISIYQDEVFYQFLTQTLQDKKVRGKNINISFLMDIDNAKNTDLLFVPTNKNNQLPLIASTLRRSETLLVTDNSVDKHNVMLNLINNELDSSISFEVNKSNIIYEKLNVSAQLLLLGGTELDVATLYRETERAMQKIKQREVELNTRLATQESLLQNSEEKLTTLNLAVQQREKAAAKSQQELQILKKDISEQQLAVKTKEERLSTLALQLESANEELSNQQKSVKKQEQENKRMSKRIIANRDILLQQKAQITEQGQQLSQKNVELSQRKERIDKQQFYIVLMAIFITLVVLISSLVVFLFLKNKRTTTKLTQTLRNLKNMQDQLIQSEKMASLGTLTAGVAHEINTPLGIAVTSTSSALESTERIQQQFEEGALTRSAMESYFNGMKDSSNLNTRALERVIELLNNFKQVAADQVVGEIREIDAVSYINEVVTTLSAEMKKHRVNYHYQGAESLTITTIPGVLAQVLTNLVTNSLKHAFENKNSGNINIHLNSNDDNTISLIYEDDGAGMEKDVLENIYEPFFTTKRNSGGTGLGMNIVYNLIFQKLQGEIKIKSKPHAGAKFYITLPYQLS